jgi:sulfotransferase 6B1
LDEAVATLSASMDPKRSPTFRQGKSGGWRKHFTPEIRDLFKQTAGQLLIDLGYEKDLNWE